MTPKRARAKAAKTTHPETMRAVIYCRISLDKTGEGDAIERQEERCRGLAVARGWDVVSVIDDTISASKFKASERPGWRKVLAMIDAGEVDIVVTYHLDRITRTMVDLEELILLSVDRGVGVATASGDIDLTTDTGRMVARILAAVARQEVERKAERQKDAAQQRANAGKPQWSTRPFGYERDGTLREDEAAIVRQAYASVIAGASLASITGTFQDSGYLTTKAGQNRKDGTTYSGHWDTPTVRHIILSARNAAVSVYKGDVVADGTWTPIVSETTYRAAAHILNNPSRNTGGGGVRQNLMTGLALCAECGGGVKVGWRGGKKDDPKAYAVYSCRDNQCVSAPVKWLDNRVGLVISGLLMSPAGILRFSDAENDGEDRAEAVMRAANLRMRLDDLADAFAADEIDRETLARASFPLRVDLKEAEREAQHAYIASPLGTITGPASALAAWRRDDMPLDERRAVVTRILKSPVLIHRKNKGERITTKHVTIK